MDQTQRQIDSPNADACRAGVRRAAIRPSAGGALVPPGFLLIKGLIRALGIVEIPRAARAAT